MPAAALRPARRLRGKTPPPRHTQQPLPAPLELLEAPATAKRQVYLVTFPHPRLGSTSNGIALVAPRSKTKREMMACVLDALANPEYANPRQAHSGVQPDQLGVFR